MKLLSSCGYYRAGNFFTMVAEMCRRYCGYSSRIRSIYRDDPLYMMSLEITREPG